MTAPEENQPKTTDTDQVVMRPGGDPDRRIAEEPRPQPDERTEVGAELEEEMRRSGLSREDFGEEEER